MPTYTYDPSLSTPKDQVRFRIGDTEVSPVEMALFSDEEITAQLMATGDDVSAASIAIVRGLISRYSRMSTISVGDTSIQAGNLAKQYRDLLADLERAAATASSAAPFAGGISFADKEARECDPDRVPSRFRRDGVGSAGGRQYDRDRWWP